MGDAVRTLVERDGALAAMRGALARAEDGSGSILVFDGAHGLGRTSLLDFATALARDAGWVVLADRCDRFGRALDGQLVRHLGGWATVGDAAITPPLLTGMVERRADEAGRPVLVCIDDVHDADSGSLEALAYLASRIDQLPCVVVASQRTGAVTANDSALAHVRRAPRTEVHRLATLSSDGCRALAAQDDIELDDAALDALMEATGGNPYLITHSLRFDGIGRAPGGVVDHLRAQMAPYGADGIRVAVAATLLDTRASVATVSELTELPRSAVGVIVDSLCELGVLQVERARITVRYGLLRNAILELPSDPTSVRMASLRAAELAMDAGTDAATVAAYLLVAPCASSARTVDWLLDGARAALRAGATTDAIGYFERALEEPITDPDIRRCTTRELAAARAAVGDTAAALDALRGALAAADEPAERSDIRVSIANVLIGSGLGRDAMEEFAAAADELDGQPGAIMRVALLRAGRSSFGQFLDEGAEPSLEPLMRTLPHDPLDDSTDARVLMSYTSLAWLLENRPAAQAQPLATRALIGGHLLHEGDPTTLTYLTAAAVLAWTDHWTAVLPRYDAAIDAAQARGNAAAFALASSSRGGLHMRRGDVRAAIPDLVAGLEGRHAAIDAYRPMMAFMAAMAAFQGEDDDVVALACEASERLGSHAAVAPFVLGCAGYAALNRGDQEQAYSAFTNACHRADAIGMRAVVLADWRHAAVEAAAVVGKSREALGLADESLSLARRVGAPRALGLALRARATVVAELTERLQLLDEAVAVLADARIDSETARALCSRALAHEQQDDIDAALADRTRAADLAVASGARRVARELTQLGVAARESDASAVLTARELQIALLAAQGTTNRVIAQRLFLTVKSVEWHLSNCYRKLGISGRRDLPTALAGTAAPLP